MLWAVRIRWLGYDNKWHRHTTKWHKNSGDAWEEAEAFQRSIKSYESSSSLIHKEDPKFIFYDRERTEEF